MYFWPPLLWLADTVFSYNSWTVCPKDSRLVSFDLVKSHCPDWCNYDHLSSDWSILFLAINRKLFVVETCGWCHLKLQNVSDIFFSGTFICILFNTNSFQLDIFIFRWCCNLLYTFLHWYVFYSMIQNDLSVLWASPRSFCRNCFSSCGLALERVHFVIHWAFLYLFIYLFFIRFQGSATFFVP